MWLDQSRTTQYQFYQFWFNVEDEAVEDYLKIYTLLSKEEIEHLMSQFNEQRSARVAQKTLAFEVTKLIHGQDKARSIQRISDTLFGGLHYDELTEEDVHAIAGEFPPAHATIGETSLLDVLVETKLATSKGEARQFLEASAIYINGQQFSSEKQTLEPPDVLHGHVILRRGKNTIGMVVIG